MSLRSNHAAAIVEALVAKEGEHGPSRRLIAKARRQLRRGAVSAQLLADLSAALDGGIASRRLPAPVPRQAHESGLLMGMAATLLTWLVPPTLALAGIGAVAALLFSPELRPLSVAVILGTLGLCLVLCQRTGAQ